MQRAYLVCYDIRDAKRLKRVNQLLKGYGEPWQLSVFYCVLREIDRVRIQAELEQTMNLQNDQTLIIDLGAVTAKPPDIGVIGQPLPPQVRGTVLV